MGRKPQESVGALHGRKRFVVDIVIPAYAACVDKHTNLEKAQCVAYDPGKILKQNEEYSVNGKLDGILARFLQEMLQ